MKFRDRVRRKVGGRKCNSNARSMLQAAENADNRQHRSRFVYTHLKAFDQSLDKHLLISLTYFVPRKVVP